MNKIIKFAKEQKLNLTISVDPFENHSIVSLRFYSKDHSSIHIPITSIQVNHDEEFNEEETIDFLNKTDLPKISNDLQNISSVQKQIDSLKAAQKKEAEEVKKKGKKTVQEKPAPSTGSLFDNDNTENQVELNETQAS